MDANEYQRQAGRTLLDKPDFRITDKEVMISWNAIGLAGEAGEVAEVVKKAIYHQQGIDMEKMKKELGDVLWYVAALCSHLDISLEDVMRHNVEKLRARYPEGYSPGRTTYRAGVAS
ncbi:MAG: nucleoside triphosphate pyrophosphohydrolase family protein [Acidobacteriota bacterium]|nr:nucleoside triphosphate pyrophosphohydrolase family protein [Acidobacteriota bacterium]